MHTSKKIKVIFAGIYPEKKNTAAYNRFLATVKMVKASFECEVVMPERYVLKNRILKGLVARALFFRQIIKTFLTLDKKNYNHIVFFKFSDPMMCLICWFFTKPMNIKLALERNEFPSPFIAEKNNRIKKTLYTWFVLTWQFRLFDALFLMTDELIEFYGRYAKKKSVIQKLPMTVDFSRFGSPASHQKDAYIFYAGSLSERKDGVESLINAFNKVSVAYPHISLKIAGGAKGGEEKLASIVKTLSLEGKVHFLGFVGREEIPDYLCSAKIVVLPRPDSRQARGGFPTKLGEYLASGRPVIATKVGEISEYLSENDIFFISPDNIKAELVEKMNYILSNYDQALVVAERGKYVAKNYFSLEANQDFIKRAFESVFSREI